MKYTSTDWYLKQTYKNIIIQADNSLPNRFSNLPTADFTDS